MHLTQQLRNIIKPIHVLLNYPIATGQPEIYRQQQSDQINDALINLKEAMTHTDHESIIQAISQLSYSLMSTVLIFHPDHDNYDIEQIDEITFAMSMSRLGNTPTEDLQVCYRDCQDLAEKLNNELNVNDIAPLSLIILCTLNTVCTDLQLDHFSILEESSHSYFSILWPEDPTIRLTLLTQQAIDKKDIAFHIRRDGGKGMLGFHATSGEPCYPPTYHHANYSPFITTMMQDYITK